MAGLTEETIDRFYIDVGRRIRDARVQTGATQAQLAARASMTRSSIANIEAGRQRVPVHALVMVSAALGVDPTELFSTHMTGGENSEMAALKTRLEKEPPETRDFIQGAIAQIGIQDRKEGE